MAKSKGLLTMPRSCVTWILDHVKAWSIEGMIESAEKVAPVLRGASLVHRARSKGKSDYIRCAGSSLEATVG